MKPLIFIYELLIIAPIVIVTTFLTAVTTIIGSWLGNNKFWGFYPAKIWSRIVCAISLIGIKVEGRENLEKGKSYVFVANHQGAFDIFLIYGYLNQPFKWVMKSSLRNIPLVGKACDSAGHIFISRSNPKSIQKSMEEAKRRLNGGVSVVIFPEGSRSEDGKLGRFKRGAFQVAVDLNIPIVPLTINGSYKILSKSSLLINPGKLKLTIHPAIEPNSETGHDITEVTEKCHSTIGEHIKV